MADRNEVARLESLLAPLAARANEQVARLLVEPDVPGPLAEAMRYCVLSGGKRLRPAIVMLSARAVSVSRGEVPDAANAEAVNHAAVAVELIHGYSLVHDDLPAMDDDTLRRGMPTAHVKFGQAMAILAGDALLTRAFGVLAEGPAELAGPLVVELAAGAGAAGMIAGQVADMDLCSVPDGLDGVEYIHARKTAALIVAAARMGGICAGADPAVLAALTEWSRALGLAFQMADDVLDVTADAAELGKTPGKDADAGKRSAVAALGTQAAAGQVARLSRQAVEALAPLGDAAATLRELTELLVDRKR